MDFFGFNIPSFALYKSKYDRKEFEIYNAKINYSLYKNKFAAGLRFL